MTGDGNWTWLIDGRVPTLIDAGTGDARHLDAVAEALGGRQLARVLVTHGHGDHASGAPALAAREPSAEFMKMPWPERDARLDVAWKPLADGDVIEAGDTTLLAIHTPGHAPDHLAFWHEASRSLFCGDLMLRGTTVWIPGDKNGDVGAYIASLQRVQALEPVVVYPAHGPVIHDPATLLHNYIEHRYEREAQVLNALRAGHGTAEAIAKRLYRGLRSSLMSYAEQSVRAHLRKLERDGRVRREGDGDAGAWTIIEP